MVHDTVLVDLHNVLFISPSFDDEQKKTLLAIRQTLSWFEYEKGFIDQKQAYESVSLETGGRIDQDKIEKLIIQGHSSLKIQDPVFQALKRLKTTHGCHLFALSNISRPDYESLQSRFGDLLNELFERVLTSYTYGDRKPCLSFFRRILVEIDRTPDQVVFIDDEIDNIVAAASLGIRTVHASKKNINESVRILYNLCRRDACASGLEYLRENAGQHTSIRSDGKEIKENFSQMLLLEATNDESLTAFIPHSRLFHFFQVLHSLVKELPLFLGFFFF